MHAVNPANIATMNCNRKCKSRGKLIVCATNFWAGRDNWIGEAIAKPTMKPRVIHITVIPLVSLRIDQFHAS